MYNIGALFKQHLERAGVGELFGDNHIARIYEGVHQFANSAACAVRQKDVVEVGVHAALVLEFVRNHAAQAFMPLHPRIARKRTRLARQDAAHRFGVRAAVDTLRHCVGYREYVRHIRAQTGRHFHRGGQIV